MADKVAYVFAENAGCGGSWFCIYIGGAVIADSLQETARTVRNLRKSGYTILDSNVPIGGRYRELNVKERGLLAMFDAKLAIWERHPGLSLEEVEMLEHLRKKGIKRGEIWVDDVELYPPEMQESAARLTGGMEDALYPPPQTGYYLHADGNPYVVGRNRIQKFSEDLKYFDSAISLRNASPEEARGFSAAGRPFTGEELAQLIREGLEIGIE